MIDYEKLKNWPIPEIRQKYTNRDTMLYALGVGLGIDPTDEQQLQFVYEKGLKTLPTYPVVLGYPGLWLKERGTGIDWMSILHGEQGLHIHKLPPAEGEVIGKSRVTGIVDKGAGKGALLYTEQEIYNANDGELLCTLTKTTFCIANGGYGGPSDPVRLAHSVPDRQPDLVEDLQTLSMAGLIYRLSGDYHILHADPQAARAAGFERPILHGLCTFGVVGHAIIKSVCDYDPTRLISIDVRFSAPVYPGETIRTEIWEEAENIIYFRSRILERDIIVLNNGRAEIRK
ncbi:MAG: MaoC family dehydratase N-terminal domain-containing protein [Deltaproteobacteria bacterium]|nr:MaoC family dehydratase N-terminal domain-containing protein [Deltaproteobacteria bacterium]